MKKAFIRTKNVKNFVTLMENLKKCPANIPKMALVYGGHGLGKSQTRSILISILDVTPTELAEELSISRCHISNMIAGRRNSKELNEYLFNKIFYPDSSNLN